MLAALIGPVIAMASEIDPVADRIFRDSCRYLAQAKAFSAKVEVWKDLELPNGQMIQITQNIELQQRRPNLLHVEVRSPRRQMGFWCADKKVTMLDRAANLYGVMEAPEEIDKAIDALEERFGVEIPLGDLLVADPYRNLMDNMQTAADLGRVTLLGSDCRHLAFTGERADCQIWLAEGPQPLPRKIVITFKDGGGLRQITQIYHQWDLVSPIADSMFVFTAPEGASMIVVNPRKDDESAPVAPESAPAAK